MDFCTVDRDLEIGAFDFVKIDVEGAELEVLLGMEAQIKLFRPYIITEILSAYSRDNAVRVERQKGILDFAIRNRYEIYRIIEDSSGRIRTLMPIDDFDPGFDKDQCNYLIVPSEQKAELALRFKKFLCSEF